MKRCVAAMLLCAVWNNAKADEIPEWKRGVIAGIAGAASVVGAEYGIKLVKHLATKFKQTKPEKVAVSLGYLKIEGEITTSEKYINRIVGMAKTDEIRGLVVAIDTNGGSPGAAQALCKELRRFAEKKPIVVVIETKCLSAGYYIALGADIILSMPTSMIGSIGVISHMYGIGDPQQKASKVNGGIEGTYEDRTLTAGTYKGWGNPYAPFTEDHQAYMQERIDEGYETFCRDVAQARGVDLETAVDWAEGKIFTGNQAHKLKLVDGFGTIVDAEKVIISNLKTRNIKDISWPEDDDNIDVTFIDVTPEDSQSSGWQIASSGDALSRQYGETLLTC